MRNAQMLKTCWLLPMLIIAGTFAVHMINLSHDITKKKQFQQQLTVPPHIQTLFWNRIIKKKKCFTFLFKEKHVINLTNVLLTDNFINFYQTHLLLFISLWAKK